jgi:hypothetical protein
MRIDALHHLFWPHVEVESVASPQRRRLHVGSAPEKGFIFGPFYGRNSTFSLERKWIPQRTSIRRRAGNDPLRKTFTPEENQ